MGAGLQCPPGPVCLHAIAGHSCKRHPGEKPFNEFERSYNRLERPGLHIPLGLLFTRGEELPVLELLVTTLGNSVFFEGFAG